MSEAIAGMCIDCGCECFIRHGECCGCGSRAVTPFLEQPIRSTPRSPAMSEASPPTECPKCGIDRDPTRPQKMWLCGTWHNGVKLYQSHNCVHFASLRSTVKEQAEQLAAVHAWMDAHHFEKSESLPDRLRELSVYVEQRRRDAWAQMQVAKEAKEQLAGARQEVERMRPLAKFGEKIARTFDFMGDIFGGYIQDWGVECGVFSCEPYDSAKHGPSDEFEDGDDYYTFNAALLAQSEGEEPT